MVADKKQMLLSKASIEFRMENVSLSNKLLEEYILLDSACGTPPSTAEALAHYVIFDEVRPCVERFIVDRLSFYSENSARFCSVRTLAAQTQSMSVFLKQFCNLFLIDADKAANLFPRIRLFADEIPCINQLVLVINSADEADEIRKSLRHANRIDSEESVEAAFHLKNWARLIAKNLNDAGRNREAIAFSRLVEEF